MIPLIILVILFNSILSINGQQQTIPGQALPLSPEPGSSASALSNKVATLKSSQESTRNQLQAIEQAKQLALQRVGQLGSDQARQQALEQVQKLDQLGTQKRAEIQAQQQAQQQAESELFAQQIAQIQTQQPGQISNLPQLGQSSNPFQQQTDLQDLISKQGLTTFNRNGIDIDKLIKFRDEIVGLAQARRLMDNQKSHANWYAQAIAQAQAKKFYRDQARQRTYEQLRNRAQAEAANNPYDQVSSQSKFDALQKTYQQEQAQRAQDNAVYQAQIDSIQKQYQRHLSDNQQNQRFGPQTQQGLINPLVLPINNLLNNLLNGLLQLKSDPSVNVDPLPFNIEQTLKEKTPLIQTNIDLDKLLNIQKLFLQLGSAKVNGYNDNPLLPPLNTMLTSVDSILGQLLGILGRGPGNSEFEQAQLLAQQLGRQ